MTSSLVLSVIPLRPRQGGRFNFRSIFSRNGNVLKKTFFVYADRKFSDLDSGGSQMTINDL